MVFLFLFLSTDFPDFTEGWKGGVNHGFTRIYADFPTSDLIIEPLILLILLMVATHLGLVEMGRVRVRIRQEGNRELLPIQSCC